MSAGKGGGRSRAALALALSLGAAGAACAQPVGGGPLPVPLDDTTEIARVVHPHAVAAAQALGFPAPPRAVVRSSLGQLDFPLRVMPNSHNTLANGISNFADRDPSGGIRDFACGNRTYDGHGGTDFFITPFRWAMMDAEEIEVVTAAPGTIVLKQDGNFDRQCLPLDQLPTDAPANFVAIRQDDGVFAYYYHMKSGTVTALPIGTHVAPGQHLGFVGSSGHSTGPHLHFELNSGAQGVVGGATAIDPFGGQCGSPATLWKNQWEAQSDVRLLSLTTHRAPPVVPTDNCDTTGQIPNYADSFAPGAIVYGLVSLRDQRPSDAVTLQFIRPDGTVFNQGLTGAPGSGTFTSSYWYRSVTLPASGLAGTWKLRALLNTADHGNFQLERAFFVGAAPATTSVVSAVLPSGRSVSDTGTATVFAAMINSGTSTAYGCSIAPETPVAADFVFQTVSAQNVLTGGPNVSADIPPGSVQNFVAAFTPRLNFEAVTRTANAVDVTLHYHCTNAPNVTQIEGLNDVILSFSPDLVADVIAIGDTVSHDGVLRIPGAGKTGAFVVATSNVGAAVPITVTPVATSPMPLTLLVCETNPASGACIAAPTPSVSRTLAAGETATWGIFGQATGAILLDPAGNRISVRYVDAGGILRGATSVAVATP
jgi:murein DD-endopeptidase MepM/ murein hydrolase activator NlpD